jgi:hypothetical protein
MLGAGGRRAGGRRSIVPCSGAFARSMPTADTPTATAGSMPLCKPRDRPSAGIASNVYVARRMRVHGVCPKTRRRFRATTNSRHAHPVAPNRLDRQFDVAAPNRVWTAAITYIPTAEGWLYLAIVLDLYSRQIVGWAMDATMSQQLTLRALTMALQRHRPSPGLVHHSDRGSQYACRADQQLLAKHGIVCSMSRKGKCWEPAGSAQQQGTHGVVVSQPQDGAGSSPN